MKETQREATEGSPEPRRFRYLIDIIVLVAVTFLLDAVLGAFVQVPMNLEKGFVLDAIGKMLLVGVGCGLVWVTGREIGRYRIKEAGELDPHLHHRHGVGGNCFPRHVPFGKGGVSPRPEQVQGCTGKSGTRSPRRFVCIDWSRIL